jgi:hypothetical protein
MPPGSSGLSPLEPKDGTTIDRIVQLMNQAEAGGIGYSCAATPTPNN